MVSVNLCATLRHCLWSPARNGNEKRGVLPVQCILDVGINPHLQQCFFLGQMATRVVGETEGEVLPKALFTTKKYSQSCFFSPLPAHTLSHMFRRKFTFLPAPCTPRIPGVPDCAAPRVRGHHMFPLSSCRLSSRAHYRSNSSM